MLITQHGGVIISLYGKDRLNYRRATPVLRAASATALATAGPTLGSNAAGMMYSSFSSSSEIRFARASAAAIFISSLMSDAMAIAGLISDDELNEEYIIPAAFDPRVGPAVAKAVAEAARATGVARI